MEGFGQIRHQSGRESKRAALTVPRFQASYKATLSMNFHNKPKSFALVQAASMPMIRLHVFFEKPFLKFERLMITSSEAVRKAR
jgi:hypothetical protein